MHASHSLGHSYLASTQSAHPFAAVFPGQGSQSVGMGRLFYDEFKEAKIAFEEASDALSLNMTQLCFEGPDSVLQLTENTQPAILTTSIAIQRVLSARLGFTPIAASGHSIGEYSALVASRVLSFSDAVRAVRARGRAMQKAVPVGQGAMAAVMGLSEEQVIAICKTAEGEASAGPLSAANFNAPGQIVISGSAKTLDWLKEHLTSAWLKDTLQIEARPKLIPLAVSAPFHCALMQPAEDEMAVLLKATAFNAPQFPVVQNTTGKASTDPEVICEQLIRQISRSVQWIKCQNELVQLGAKHFIEVGSGKVLAGLAKKTLLQLETFTTFSMNSIEDLKKFETELSALGRANN